MESVRIWEGRQRNDTRTVTDEKPVKTSHRSEAKRRERALKSESSSHMLRLALALPVATGPWNMIKIFVLATIMRPSRSETHKKERNNKQKTMTETNREEWERGGGGTSLSWVFSYLFFVGFLWLYLEIDFMGRSISEVQRSQRRKNPIWLRASKRFVSLSLSSGSYLGPSRQLRIKDKLQTKK